MLDRVVIDVPGMERSRLDFTSLGQPDQVGGVIAGVRGNLVGYQALSGRELVVPIEKVFPYSGQPRTVFPESEIKKLAAEIKAGGQQMPMVCAAHESEEGLRFVLADGERRLRALTLLGSSEAFIAIHPYLTEEALYKAAAATHQDTKGLKSIERILMLARLYEIARGQEQGLTVQAFVAREKFKLNDVHFGMRVKKLPPQLLEMCVKEKLAYAGLIYLMNRVQESEKEGVVFPQEGLLRILEAMLNDKRKKREKEYLSENETRRAYERALVRVGRGDEAVRVRTRTDLAIVLTALRKARKDGTEFFDAIEEPATDPLLVDILSELLPEDFASLESAAEDLELILANLKSLLALAAKERDR